MPKKTKRQKLRADRRHKSFIPLLPEVIPSAFPIPTAFQFKQTNPKVIAISAQDTEELAAIRIDLTKTIILAIVAVGVELLVYWRFFSK